MTHPGAGSDETTIQRDGPVIISQPPKIKEARPVPIAPLPHPPCTLRRTANDKSYIRVGLTICNSDLNCVCG